MAKNVFSCEKRPNRDDRKTHEEGAMKHASFVITSTIAAKSSLLYHAFLDSAIHSEFTGSTAHIENKVGGKFTAWDGYISGNILELDEPRRIRQSWRTTDFSEGDEDSLLEIEFIERDGMTQVRLKHSNLPEGTGEEYKQGWKEFYLEPLAEYVKRQKP